MSASTSYSLRLIQAIERDEPAEVRKVLSEVINRDDVDLSSPVGPLRATALQFAAWRGWTDLLVALTERGADVNGSDKLGRCPLHYAAHQGNAEVTEWLVRHGASLDNAVAINSCTRNFFRVTSNENHSTHLVIGKNLPLPECWGRTPLHQAVRNNHPEIVRILVTAGARVDAKDEGGVTSLLLAGSNVESDNSEEFEKFADIVDILVSANASTDVFRPDTGSSALHHAAILGSARATRRLLEGGASPLFQCSSTGSTALHIAAAAGSFDTLLVLLNAVDPSNINIEDKVGRTPLHRAAYQGHRECIELIVNYGGNLAATTKTGVSAITAIFARVPRPLNFVKDILDAKFRPAGNSPAEKSPYVNVDFGVLAPKGQLQMAVISSLIDAASSMEQLGILQHPLVESFLSLKWSRLRGFFFLLVLVHVVFVLSLSGYAIVLVRHNDDFTLPRHVLTLCSMILITHNTIQIFMVPRYYLRQFETWSSLTCAIISLVTSTLAIGQVDGNVGESTASNKIRVVYPQWTFHAISIAILFAWVQMMLLVGRFPSYGYYALMFSTVLKNILKVLLAYVCLIVGFALSFFVLFHRNEQFCDFWRALVKTVVMMMGEYEYSDMFENDNPSYEGNANSTKLKSTDYYIHVTSRMVFLSFIVLASIVLMNLMIGLAVNDIQGLEKEGHIRRLLKQAEFVAHLERVTSHRIFRSKWLHSRLRTLVDSRRSIVTRITIGYTEKYPHQSLDISPELLDAIFSLTSKNSVHRDIGSKMDDKNLSVILSNLERLVRQLQNGENGRCQVPSSFGRSFVKRKVAGRLASANV